MGAIMPDEEQGDPNKETMLEPGEGDAAGLLPSVGGYDDSDADDKTPDTEPATAEGDKSDADTGTDTGDDDDNPDLALLRDNELDKTYKTVPAALAGLREKERYIEQQRRDNDTLRQTLRQAYENRQAEREPMGSNEDLAELFTTDPEAALRRMGYVNREQINPLVNQLQTVQARLEHQAFVGAVGQYEDLKDVAAVFRAGRQPEPGASALWDAMDNIYRSSPSLQAANMTDLIPLLHSAAVQHLSGATVNKVSDSRKRGASTTSAGRGARRAKGGQPDWDNMTEEEILNLHKEAGLIT
jgi:hypothetical protein